METENKIEDEGFDCLGILLVRLRSMVFHVVQPTGHALIELGEDHNANRRDGRAAIRVKVSQW